MVNLIHFLLLLLGTFSFFIQPTLAQQSSSSTSVQPEAQLLERSKPIERKLKADDVHAYNIPLDQGQFLDAVVNQRGIDVVVRVFGPDGAKLDEIDALTADQGDETIALEAKAPGTYRIEVSSLEKDAKPGRYEIKINDILSAQAYAAQVAETLRKQQAVISWLKANAIPLKTVEAGNDFSDLQPLKQTFKDIHYVGLGEGTHGTREFFQVKHRLLEFLVREMGFRVFALEGSYAALQVINDYVTGKMDDGAKALDSQGFWTWNTEEVRAMMDWARHYNASVSPDKQLKFIGFDIQFNQPGKDKLLAYLKRVEPEHVTETDAFIRTNLDSLNSVLSTPSQQKEARSKLKVLKNKYANLVTFLEANKADLIAKSSQPEYEQMRDYARTIVQYTDAYSQENNGAGSAMRDRYMAANFKRLVEREPAGTRFVIWAHNGHIQTDSSSTYTPIGAFLRRFYGNDYYALCFAFNQGSFQAREAQPKDLLKRMLMGYTVAPAPKESAEWYLTQSGLKTFIVDFRSAPKNADIIEWLTLPHPMRSIGSIYHPASDPYYFSPAVFSQQCDGLLFIDTTTRARPNPSVKNVAEWSDK